MPAGQTFQLSAQLILHRADTKRVERDIQKKLKAKRFGINVDVSKTSAGVKKLEKELDKTRKTGKKASTTIKQGLGREGEAAIAKLKKQFEATNRQVDRLNKKLEEAKNKAKKVKAPKEGRIAEAAKLFAKGETSGFKESLLGLRGSGGIGALGGLAVGATAIAGTLKLVDSFAQLQNAVEKEKDARIENRLAVAKHTAAILKSTDSVLFSGDISLQNSRAFAETLKRVDRAQRDFTFGEKFQFGKEKFFSAFTGAGVKGLKERRDDDLRDIIGPTDLKEDIDEYRALLKKRKIITREQLSNLRQEGGLDSIRLNELEREIAIDKQIAGVRATMLQISDRSLRANDKSLKEDEKIAAVNRKLAIVKEDELRAVESKAFKRKTFLEGTGPFGNFPGGVSAIQEKAQLAGMERAFRSQTSTIQQRQAVGGFAPGIAEAWLNLAKQTLQVNKDIHAEQKAMREATEKGGVEGLALFEKAQQNETNLLNKLSSLESHTIKQTAALEKQAQESKALRASQLGLRERVLGLDKSGLQQLIRDTLAARAAEQQGLRALPPAQQKGALRSLNFFGDKQDIFGTARTGTELKEELLEEFLPLDPKLGDLDRNPARKRQLQEESRRRINANKSRREFAKDIIRQQVDRQTQEAAAQKRAEEQARRGRVMAGRHEFERRTEELQRHREIGIDPPPPRRVPQAPQGVMLQTPEQRSRENVMRMRREQEAAHRQNRLLGVPRGVGGRQRPNFGGDAFDRAVDGRGAAVQAASTNMTAAAERIERAIGVIPESIDMKGNHTVNATLNGADVMRQLEPSLQQLVMSAIDEAIRKHIGIDGETKGTMPFSNVQNFNINQRGIVG